MYFNFLTITYLRDLVSENLHFSWFSEVFRVLGGVPRFLGGVPECFVMFRDVPVFRCSWKYYMPISEAGLDELYFTCFFSLTS